MAPVWPPVVIGVMVAILIVALAASLTDRGSLIVKNVSSFWGNVPMTCHTARFEQDGGAFELFHCRALGAGRLPPGAYVTPDAQWSSDLTKQEAQVNVMQITRGGELRGWAAYPRG